MERFNRLCEQIEFFFRARNVRNTGAIFQDGQLVQIRTFNFRRNTPVPQMVPSQIAGNLEEKRLCRMHGLHKSRPPNPKVGLLHQIIDIPNRRKGAPQVSRETCVVEMNFILEPTSGFGVRRRHTIER